MYTLKKDSDIGLSILFLMLAHIKTISDSHAQYHPYHLSRNKEKARSAWRASQPSAAQAGARSAEDLMLPPSLGIRPCLFSPHKSRKRKKAVTSNVSIHAWSTKWSLFTNFFSHRWAVNRETNLMSLHNPWFATLMLQYHPLIID